MTTKPTIEDLYAQVCREACEGCRAGYLVNNLREHWHPKQYEGHNPKNLGKCTAPTPLEWAATLHAQLEAAKARVDALNRAPDPVREQLVAALKALHKQREHLNAWAQFKGIETMSAALKAVEWIQEEVDEQRFCPCCRAWESYGHNEGCGTRAALTAAEVEDGIERCNVVDVPPVTDPRTYSRGQCVLPFGHDGDHEWPSGK